MTAFAEIARRAGGWLPLIGIAALAGTLGTLALPVVLGKAVDEIVAGHPSGQWLVAAAGLIALGVVCDLIDAFAGTACAATTTAWLRNRLVRHVLAIGPEGARRFDTGDLVSRVSSNAADAAHAGPSVIGIAAAAVPPIGSLVLLAVIDMWLAVAFLAGTALVALVLRAFTRRTTQIITKYQQVQGRIAARLTESLAGARTIAAAATVGREEERVLQPLPELAGHGRHTWEALSRASAQAAVVAPLVLVGVLAAGGLELYAGRITPGELFAASQYAVLGAGLGRLTGVFGGLARAKAAAYRAGEVLDVDAVEYGTRTLPGGAATLELRGVSVVADGTTLLDEVDLTVPGGATVAVVGHSGAGKSVLAALAARLRDPDNGQVLLDGVPLPELDHDTLRSAVACAFERPILVGSTVIEAIGAGLDPDRVRAAARDVHAHEFVSRLPHGYLTPLADAPLSGGEYQRLGLARAWRADRLLVLDDATSSLDMVTEMQIGATLTPARASGARGQAGGLPEEPGYPDAGTRPAMPNGVPGPSVEFNTERDARTRLIITHRAATAARADLVVWLEKGRVRAVGRHEELGETPEYQEVFG